MFIFKLLNGLLQKIFKYLSRGEVYQDLLVCKKWCPISFEKFYKQIPLNNKSVDVLNLLLLKADVKEDFQSLAPLVQQLNVSSSVLWVPGIFGSKFFTLLVSHLPNLMVLKYDSSVEQFLYAFSEPLNDALNKNQGCLRHIQQISFYGDYLLHCGGSVKSLLPTWYKMRESMTHLDIRCSTEVLSMNGVSGTFDQLLPHFINLTHSTLHNHFGRRGRNIDINPFPLIFFSVLNTCHTLKYRSTLCYQV